MLSSRLVFPSSIFPIIRFSSSTFASYVPVMINTLHQHLAAAIAEPEVQPVLGLNRPRAAYNPALFFRNTVPPGKHGNRAPCLKRCPQLGEKEPVAFEPGPDSAFEPVGKIRSCGLPVVQPPEKPLGTEPVPEAGNLILGPGHSPEEGGIRTDPELLQPEKEHVPVRDNEFGSCRWRRGPDIGSKIRKRYVDFMADGAYHRHRAS